MNEFMKVLFSLSISGTFLIAFMLLLAPALQKTVGKTARYYIWLIVLLRFLVPVTFEASLVNHVFGLAEQNAKPAGLGTASLETTSQTKAPNKDMVLQEEVNDMVAFTAEEARPPFAKGLFAWAGEWTLFMVWLFVFAFLMVKKIVQYARYNKRMREGAVPVLDSGLLAVLERERKKRHMLQRVKLYVNDAAGAPMLLGFFRPAIVVPVLPEQEQEAADIISHELVHHMRLDLLYKWLVQWIVCLHWFNPLMRRLAAEIGRQCEISCDEAVLKHKDKNARIAYGNMLLRFIKAGNAKCAEAMLTLSENGEQVKERLGAIMQDKKRKGGSVISAIAAVLVLSMALGLGGYATKSFAEGKNEQDIVYYDYYMSTYFRGEYLISLGADLPEKAKQTFETNWELTLDDGQEVTLYFYSEISVYADNEAVMEAIKEAANILAKDMKKSRKSVSSIGIREIEGPFTGTPKQLAAQFYEEDKIAGFQAVAGNLEEKELEQYWKLFYKELDYAYFSTVLEYIPEEDQKQIAEQSYEENEYAFFAMVLPYLPKEEQRKIAEQSYGDDNYGFFSILVDEMNEDQRKEWLERADKDEKIEYRNIIETAE